jgi:hypothetical protein
VTGALAGQLVLLAACGSGGGSNGRDAGSEAGASPAGPGGASSDDASSGDDAGTPDATPPAGGQGTLEGTLAFPVGQVVMGFVTGGCPDRTGDAGAGVLPAVEIGIVQAGGPSFCDTRTSAIDGGAYHALYMGIATGQWASYAGATLTASLAPGTFIVGNQHLDDEDLCMLPAGSSAYLVFGQADGQELAIAVSGTFTLDTVAADSVSGSFDVIMGSQFGLTDAGTSRLSGTFNALVCP